MNALTAARLGLAGSLVGYVVVIGLGRAGVLGAQIGFRVAIGLIAAMAVCAAACLVLQVKAFARRSRPPEG